MPRHVAPRWARVFVYGMNRARYLRDLAVVPPPPPPKTIGDLPTEILVKIFWYVLSANNNGEYNVALPRVCSRWTRVMYDFVYVQGFGVEDYSDLLGRQLSLFADRVARSDYNAVLPEVVCRNVLGRYRLGMHPRVLAYTILRAEDKEGCVHSVHAVRATQQFCYNSYGLVFEELKSIPKINLMICIFVVEYTQHVFASLRLRLQTVLETKFIRRLDIAHLIDSERSILERTTVWHEFARDIKDSLEVVHGAINERLECAYSGVELSHVHAETDNIFTEKCRVAAVRYIRLK